GLQIGEYRRIELKRIAHHFAPVLRLEPGILVDEAEVVEGALKGTLLRLWLGRGGRGPRAMKVRGEFFKKPSKTDQNRLNGVQSPTTNPFFSTDMPLPTLRRGRWMTRGVRIT